MATLQQRIEDATSQIEKDADILNKVANGDAQTTVPTDSGDLDSVAKKVADIEAALNTETERLISDTEAKTDKALEDMDAEVEGRLGAIDEYEAKLAESVNTAAGHETASEKSAATAKQEADRAEAAASQAEAVTNIESASTSKSGIVELATVTEAKAGTDSSRAVTPAGLSAAIDDYAPVAASTTQSGIVELATVTEAKAGTDSSRAVTPAGLSAAIDDYAPVAASTTQSGIVELATSGEALNKDNLKALTGQSGYNLILSILAERGLIDNQWIELYANGNSDGPLPRADAETVFTGTDLLLFGGVTSNYDRLNDLWKWSIADKAWSLIHANNSDGSPSPREDHQMTVYNNCGLLFGGGIGSTVFYNDLWELSFSDNSWTQLKADGNSDGPSQRNVHATSPTDTGFLLFGGYGDSGRLNDVWEYTRSTNSWTQLKADGNSDGPSQRNVHATSPTDTGFLLFGGYDGSSRLNDVWEYTRSTNSWTQLKADGNSDGPSERNTHATSPTDTGFLLFGGYGDSGRLNDVWEYTRSTNSWTQLKADGNSDGPSERNGHEISPTDTGFLLFGGYGDSSRLNDVWEFIL